MPILRPKIKDHTIKKLIHTGGMSTVWLAENELTKRKVSVKILNQHYRDNHFVEDLFYEEAKAMSRLKHDGILDFYAFVQKYQAEEGRPYVIMEYVKGIVINEYIRNTSGPIPEQKLIPLFIKILDAVGYAHSESVIGGYLSPNTILVDEKERIKVLNFRLSRYEPGLLIGRQDYISPEELLREQISKLTAIYLLGRVLFYMATGINLFGPSSGFSEYEACSKIVNENLPHAPSYYPGVSEKVNNIIQKATANKPRDRFQSCEEFSQSLHQLLAST